MKKILFFCITAALFILHLPRTQAQDKHLVDSLQGLLKTAKQDTSKANILIQLSVAYWGADLEKSLEYASQSLALSKQIGYKKGIGKAYNGMGLTYNKKGDYIQALEVSKKALDVYEEIGDKGGISSCYNCIGLIYEGQGDYPEAFRHFFAALKINEETGDARKKADVYNNIGILYYDQGNYPEALKNQLSSLKIKEKIGFKKGIAQSYYNLGKIYHMLGNYPEALKYHQEALKLFEELGDKVGGSYSHIGLIYLDMGNYPEAIKNEFRALKIYEEMGIKNGIRFVSDNIGKIFYTRGEYQESLKYYTSSLKISEEMGNKAGIASSCNNIGNVYLKLKKFSEADHYLNKGLRLAKEVGGLDDIKSSYASLARLDSARNNFQQALVNYRLFITYRDSIINKGNTQKIVQSQMQYEFDKKEESAKAEQEKKDIRQRNIRYSMMGGLAGLVIFLLVVFWQRNKISKEKKRSDELLVKSDNLLLNILPSEVAEEIKKDGHSKAKTFSMVTVMFTDFKDFSAVSEKVSAELLVAEIDHCFSAFDNIIQKHSIEKIKTVGDAYICVGGMPALTLTHAVDILNTAIEIRNFMLERKKEQDAIGGISFELRIGIHTGPVVAGIVGVKKYAYDIWGDTVNIAARMEQNSEAGKINISGSTYELVKSKHNCVHRGKIEAKNKGMIDMYFVEA